MQFNPSIDQHWTLDELENIQDVLKAEKFDLVLDLQKNVKSRQLVKAMAVEHRNFDKINVQKWLYVHFKKPALPNLHLVDRYFLGLNDIGINNDGQGLDFFINPEAKVESVLPNEKFMSIAIGAAHETKQIPLEILEPICEKIKSPILLLGGKQDEEKGQLLANKFSQVISLAGALSLHESAKVIEHSEVLLCSDTGLMHMAVGLKKPTVVIWGNTVPEFGMYPYYGKDVTPSINCQVEGLKCRPCSKLGKKSCPKKHFSCMLDQNVPQIVEKLTTFI